MMSKDRESETEINIETEVLENHSTLEVEDIAVIETKAKNKLDLGEKEKQNESRKVTYFQIADKAFSSKGFLIQIRPSSIRAIENDESTSDIGNLKKFLLEHIALDLDFSLTLSLIRSVLNTECKRTTKKIFIDAIIQSLPLHPYFLDESLNQQAVSRLENVDVINERIIRYLTSDQARISRSKKEIVKKVENIKTNEIVLLLLIQSFRKQWKSEELFDRLSVEVWRSSTLSGPVNDRDAILGLSDPESLKSIPFVLQISRSRENRLRDEMATLQLRTDNVFQRAIAAESEVSLLKNQLQDRDEAIRTFRAQLEDMRTQLDAINKQADISSTHMRDDYEILRTRVGRMLSKQMGLLADGRLALESQLIEVADEFVERVMEAMAKEQLHLKNLEEGA